MTFKQAVVGVAVVFMSSLAQAGVTKADWGKTADGTPVQIYTLSNENLTVLVTKLPTALGKRRMWCWAMTV